jgi:hypothetical protein
MYPDNENRANRVVQLHLDCVELIAKLMEDKQIIDTLLLSANKVIMDAYKDKSRIVLEKYTIGSTDSDEWAPFVVSTVIPCFAIPTVNAALLSTGRWVAVQTGRMTEEAVVSLEYGSMTILGKAGMWAGGAVILAAIAVALDSIVDSIEGAIRRASLRGMINEQIAPRIDLKRKAMINHQLQLTLSSIIDSFNAIKCVPGITDEQLTMVTQNLVNNSKDCITGIDEDAAKAALYSYDQARGSWMNEDHYVS